VSAPFSGHLYIHLNANSDIKAFTPVVSLVEIFNLAASNYHLRILIKNNSYRCEDGFRRL
jgi:hypothetical protein